MRRTPNKPNTIWVVPLADGTWEFRAELDGHGQMCFQTEEQGWKLAVDSSLGLDPLIVVLVDIDLNVKQVFAPYLNIIKIEGQIYEPDSPIWSMKLL